MRELKDFSLREWLRLLPLIQSFKQLRNDLWLSIYKSIRPGALESFLRETQHLAGRNIALVVAFEQPWALDWLLRMARRHLTDTTVLVFDNSRQPAARQDIERVCRDHGTPYLALPTNRTRHVNRSHGMALTWIFHNVVRAIRPRIFAFIDHDMIPVRDLSLSERLGDQPFFGWERSTDGRVWNLWAGYCIYDFSRVADVRMNFLYDFSRGLDTGGRNWSCLYRYHDRSILRSAGFCTIDVREPATGETQSVQYLDERWLHIGAISYKDKYRSKLRFYRNLAGAFDSGTSWAQIFDASNADPAKHDEDGISTKEGHQT